MFHPNTPLSGVGFLADAEACVCRIMGSLNPFAGVRVAFLVERHVGAGIPLSF